MQVAFAMISRVAMGSRWKAYVVSINIGCYYIIGVSIGMFLGCEFNLSFQVSPYKSICACIKFG